MGRSLVKNGQQQAKKLLTLQAILIIAVASLGLIKELTVALALLSGGIAVLVPNCYFTYKAFSKSGAQAMKQVVNAFYSGEAVKINLSAGLLIVVFILFPGFEGYILIGYITALLCQFLAPVVIKNN